MVNYRQAIFNEINIERCSQEHKWGNELDDTANTPWMWAAYIAQYSTQWQAGTFLPLKRPVVSNFRACMVKVASVAVAAIESVDRQRTADGQTFYEDSSDESEGA